MSLTPRKTWTIIWLSYLAKYYESTLMLGLSSLEISVYSSNADSLNRFLKLVQPRKGSDVLVKVFVTCSHLYCEP
jgi:hypothetical protein